jgi:NAD-dependent DNA ligase
VYDLNYSTAAELIGNIAGHSQAAVLMEKYGSLSALARVDEHELTELPGVGVATAAAVKSAQSGRKIVQGIVAGITGSGQSRGCRQFNA